MSSGWDVTAVLDHLQDFLSEIHWRWDICVAVFGGDNADVLNRRTGRVFACFQAALVDSVILELAKLFDRPRMGGKKNPRHPLSLYRALEDLSVETATREALGRELDELKAKAAPILARRDGRIAHNDEEIKSGAETLAGIPRRLIEEVLGGASRVYDRMSMAHDGVQRMAWTPTDQERWQAETLVRFVARGNAELDGAAAR